MIGQLDSTSDGREAHFHSKVNNLIFKIIYNELYNLNGACVCTDDWEMSHQDECDTDKLTGLEDFGVLLRPLGLTEKKLVPDPIAFTEPDPLGALVYSTADPTKAVSPKGIMFFVLFFS